MPLSLRLALGGFAVLLVCGASALVTFVLLTWRAPVSVFESCEATPADGEGKGPAYCARLLRVGTHHGLFFSEPAYELWITRKGDSGYGHATRVGLHAGLEREDAWLARAAARFSLEGVTFEEPSGHRFFVPRAAYVGGR